MFCLLLIETAILITITRARDINEYVVFEINIMGERNPRKSNKIITTKRIGEMENPA